MSTTGCQDLLPGFGKLFRLYVQWLSEVQEEILPEIAKKRARKHYLKNKVRVRVWGGEPTMLWLCVFFGVSGQDT